MTVVLGLTELWKMTQGPDATAAERAWVERIHGAGRGWPRPSSGCSSSSRADRSPHAVAARRSSSEPLVRRAVADLQPVPPAREQQIEVEIDPDLGSAEVDPSKLPTS